MLFEPPEEFLMRKQHLLCFGAVRIVLVVEPDMGWVYFKYPVSGDGDFVCIPAEIFHNLGRRPERGFCVDVPLFVSDGFE